MPSPPSSIADSNDRVARPLDAPIGRISPRPDAMHIVGLSMDGIAVGAAVCPPLPPAVSGRAGRPTMHISRPAVPIGLFA